MGKKLHSLFFYIIIFLLSLKSFEVNAQCADYPSSINITASIQGSSTVCSDASITVNSNITQSGGTNPVYQWQQQVGNGNWTDIAGATAATLSNYSSLQNNSRFRLNAIYCQGTEEETYNGNSSGTLTVNQVKTGTVSISTNNTTICPGATVNFTASATNQGSSPTYSWRINGTSQSTSATFSYNNFNNGDKVQLFMTSSTPCVDDFASNVVTINLKSAIPDQPGAISGATEICPNTNNHTYSIASVSRANSYQWILPSGWTGSSTTNSITITSGNAGNGKILKVKALNECGESTEQSISVDVGPGKPSTPSTISNPGGICPGSSVTFSVDNDASVEYTWEIPNGWNITSGQGSNSITVTAGNYNQNGNIAVTASNDCLDSDVRNLAVTVNEPIPADPVNISGETIVCPNSNVSYTISNVQYADEYIWYIDGVEQTGQNGTSLSFNSDPPTDQLTIKVIAVNECVDPSEYSSITGATRNIKVDNGKPDPITISSNNGNELCPGDPVTFSVPDDVKADDYLWTVPTGWSINGSSNSNSISVTAGSTGQNGNINATAKSDLCGEENASFAVSVKNPAPVVNAQVITGDTTVCHNATGLKYSFPSITNATNYEWNVPAGWDITNGNGTNSITVNAGTTDGNISVVAKNDCGNASTITLAVTSTDSKPSNLGSITSSVLDINKNVCPPATNIDFFVPAASGAESYNWIFPDAGWTIVSGAGTNSITVDVSSAAQSGTKTVKVEAVNICGTSTQSSYANIEVQTHIETSAGADVTVCRDNSYPNIPLTGRADFGSSKFDPTFTTTGTGTFPNKPSNVKGEFTYYYKPTQADYNAGQVTITVSVPKPNSAKDLCGNGTGVDSMVLIFKPDPTATVSAPAEICAGETADVVFTGTANTTITYKIGNGSNQTIQIGESGSGTLTTSALTANTNVTLISSQYTSGNSCSKAITESASITVNPVPGVTMLYDDVCTSATTISPTLTNGVGAWQNGTYTASGELNSLINASTGTFNPSALTAGTYTVTYTTPEAGGCEEVEITADVNVYEKVIITSQPEAVQNCEGTNVQFSVSATGDGITYQWYKGSVATGNEISGANAATLDISNIAPSDAGNYLVEVRGTAPCAAVSSNQVELLVDENVVISEQPADVSVCENSSIEITFTATSGGSALNSNYSYQWFKGTPGSGSEVTGAISSTLSFDAASLDNSGDYYVEITGPDGNLCAVTTSDAATLTVRETPVIELTGTASICDNEFAELTFTGTPNTTVTYTLNGNNTNPLTIAIDGTGSAVLNTGNLVATSNSNTDYLYSVQSIAYTDEPDCSNAITSEATITVAPSPEAALTFEGGQIEFCTADVSSYTPTLVNVIGAVENGTFSANGLNINTETGAFVPADNAAGEYKIEYEIPATGGCETTIISLDIDIYEEVIITSQPSNIGICSTQDAKFSITATGDDLKYQWYKDGTLIPGAESATLLLEVATSEDAGEYLVKVSGTNACTPDESSIVTSDPATLNVDEDIVIIEPATDVKVCADGTTNQTFKFIAHANGAPITFTWVYADGTAVNVEGNTDYTENVILSTAYPELGFDVYEGTLTIATVEEADEAEYAIRINGSGESFRCPEATSNSFKLDVDPVPTAPSVVDVEYCIGSETVVLTAEGNNLLWYESLDDETPSETAPTPSSDVVGTTSYYVSQTPVFCESELAEIKVIVNELPVAPTITNAEIIYCLGEIAEQLSLTPDTDHTLNWYNSETSPDRLEQAPTPTTDSPGDLDYWVSQTNESGCEGPRSSITVKIKNLPLITISEDATICEGSSIDLTASDVNSTETTFEWDWEGNEGEPLTGTTVNVSPTSTTTYNLTATSEFDCINIDSVTVTVDPQTVSGTIAAPESVCINNASGQLVLSGRIGQIISWESTPGEVSEEDTATWTTSSGTIDTQAFSGLTETTTFRVAVQSGVCEIEYAYKTITIDPIPVGGELNFVDGSTTVGRVFMICESASSGYAVPLEMSGQVGTVVAWRYRADSDATWSIIANSDGTNFTGTSLSTTQIESVINNETTVFRVEMASGACTPNKFSQTAIVSVIPSDIEPAPVTVDPRTLCLGDTITLNSSTGYGANFGKFEGGAFDNSSITNKGWRITDKNGNSDYNFSSNADNIRPDKWLRSNPHEFITANINTNATSLQRWDTSLDPEGNKGFAIVSGNNTSTMETAVFNLTGLDEAILTFDQAFNLTAGAEIQVEISTNGGSSYSSEPILYSITGPATSGNYNHFGDGTPGVNQITLDLGNYIGRNNLRIRFNYTGARDGDIWTLDNIKVPEGPQDVQLIWYYDDNLDNPDNELLQIGAVNQETVQFVPEKIGWNDFEVRTALVFDTNGDPCETAENSETVRVYVYDTYKSTATAAVGECGNLDVKLSASITAGTQDGTITEFPDGDGSTVAWEVISAPEGYTFAESHFVNNTTDIVPINDPNATFQPTIGGSYTLRWKITPNATPVDGEEDLPANPCTINHVDTTFDVIDCTTLDFDGDDDYIDLGNNYTGNYFIEAWIRPFDRPLDDGSGNTNASMGVIFSSSGFEISMDNLSSKINKNGRWYHIAVSNTGQLWVDGVPSGTINVSGSGINNTSIGARYNANTKTTSKHFSGWIDELRIWNNPPDLKELRFMMNQRIKLNNTATTGSLIEGEVVPNLEIPDGISSYYTDGTHNLDQDGDRFYDQTWGDLAGYYRLISDEPDPDGLIECATFDDNLKPNGGYTPDHSINKVPGRLVNITTNQENTSPTPYCSGSDATWAQSSTWARPDVWDYPNSTYNGTALEWNIARVNHNITSDSKEITMLGLLSETEGALLSINGNHPIRITHYLLLDGNMDLVGESQLLQDHGSILANASKGWAEIDQQGRMSSFNYNYWTSPVSNQGSDNNSGYMLNQVMMDGTNPNSPQAINFQNGYFVADKPKTSPITISNEWIWDFRGGTADIYGDWTHLGSDFTEIVGAGFSMKGTDGTVAPNSQTQNYAFRGKPNNGNIPTTELYLTTNKNYLVGNPYPSAIDAEKFLQDNLGVFNGAIYYWDHFSGSTHILEEYIGGYATFSLSGSAPAISNDWRINSEGGNGSKLPKRYIPVAQGFFLNSRSVSGQNFSGDIVFNNTQRVYKKISTDPSIFLQHEEELIKGKLQKDMSGSSNEDLRMKIRVKFESPKGYHRQILVTRDDNTSNGFDLGYDAPLIENNVEDMYWWFDDNGFVIQGVPSFEKEQILPLAIKTSEGGEFKIKIDKTENWPTAKELYLHDKMNDTIHDILKEDYIAKTEAGEIKDRFELVFFKEIAQDPDPAIPDPDEVIDPDELPYIDGLVGISYSTFSKQVKISNFDLLQVNKVMIFDMGGKLIQQYDELPTQREILLGMRPVRSGVYIIKVFSENGISDKKVVIK